MLRKDDYSNYSDFVARTEVISLPAFPDTQGKQSQTEQRSSELPIHYIKRDNRDIRQTEETKAEYFPISRDWQVFTRYDCSPHPNHP
jgi:hypothetical protein